MSEEEVVDMEECSEMFDFTGFSPEDDKRLIAEVRRLRGENISLQEKVKELHRHGLNTHNVLQRVLRDNNLTLQEQETN